MKALGALDKSLNPCCNGIYLIIKKVENVNKVTVLILVVMEYT